MSLLRRGGTAARPPWPLFGFAHLGRGFHGRQRCHSLRREYCQFLNCGNNDKGRTCARRSAVGAPRKDGARGAAHGDCRRLRERRRALFIARTAARGALARPHHQQYHNYLSDDEAWTHRRWRRATFRPPCSACRHPPTPRIDLRTRRIRQDAPRLRHQRLARRRRHRRLLYRVTPPRL